MQYNDPNQGPDVGDVISEVAQVVNRNLKRFGPALLVILLVLVGAAGVYKVDPGAEGIVRRFGKEQRRAGPGLHYAVPVMEQVDVVNVEEIRRTEVGFRSDRVLPPEAMMLTGDENIVEVRMVVQYRVRDAGKYLFRIAAPEETLHGAAEVAIRTVVGQSRIDDVMTTGRAKVQAATRVLLQRLVDAYESGIEVTEVKLDNVDAPDEVKDAFNAVTRAREEKEKLVNQARGYAEDKVPRARGKATATLREAEAYKEERVLRAKGNVANFIAVLEEYHKAEDITRRRLYLETMERILTNIPNKTLVDESLAKGALPVLSIGGKAVAAGAAARPAAVAAASQTGDSQ